MASKTRKTHKAKNQTFHLIFSIVPLFVSDCDIFVLFLQECCFSSERDQKNFPLFVKCHSQYFWYLILSIEISKLWDPTKFASCELHHVIFALYSYFLLTTRFLFYFYENAALLHKKIERKIYFQWRIFELRKI